MQERLSSKGCSKCHYHRLSVQWFYNAWIMAILFLHEIHLVQLWEGFGPPGRTIGWRFHFANGSGFFLLKSLNEGIFFRSGLSYSDHSMRVFVSERVELLRSLNEGPFFFGAGWVIKITQWGYFSERVELLNEGIFSERIELLRSLNEGIFSERVELLRSLNEGI